MLNGPLHSPAALEADIDCWECGVANMDPTERTFFRRQLAVCEALRRWMGALFLFFDRSLQNAVPCTARASARPQD
jgi:hypothetical protein